MYLAVNPSARQKPESFQMREIIVEADELSPAEQRPVGQRHADELAERDEHEDGDEQQGWRR